jgi:peroxiredoxin
MYLALTGRRLAGAAVLGVCALLASTLFLAACDRGAHPGRIGDAAPEFQVSDGTRSVDLKSLRGHVVLLNFWQTSCVPCVEELPSLERLQRELPQVTVVAISNDEDAAAYQSFLRTYHVSLFTVRDPSSRIPTLYGTVKVPETYVIDRQGMVRRKFVSAQEWTSPEIVDYLKKL